LAAVIYLVRHAIAVGRSHWDGDDLDRPLTKRGQRQAAGLVELLGDAPITRVASSPSKRCVDTVAPPAEVHGLKVETVDDLAEGSTGKHAAHFLRDLAALGEAAVACTHGDVVPEVLRFLKDHGLKVVGDMTWPKGSTWALEWDGKSFSKANYLPPPA
jgi:phosphohistidine phosphatase SixA